MCKCDDCDQLHCAKCGNHTAGNVLLGGLCFECNQAAEDEYNQRMNTEYSLACAGLPSVFDRR